MRKWYYLLAVIVLVGGDQWIQYAAKSLAVVGKTPYTLTHFFSLNYIPGAPSSSLQNLIFVFAVVFFIIYLKWWWQTRRADYLAPISLVFVGAISGLINMIFLKGAGYTFVFHSNSIHRSIGSLGNLCAGLGILWALLENPMKKRGDSR